MRKGTIKVLAVTCLLSGIGACKKQSPPAATLSNREIRAAQNWFEEKVRNVKIVANPRNYRASLARTVNWNEAVMMNMGTGPVVVAPVSFKDKVFLSADISGERIYLLGDVTRLVVYRDSIGEMRYEELTFVPGSSNDRGDSSFHGLVLSEDWAGNSLAKPARMSIEQNKKTIDVVQSIEVCNTIYGYNYSPDEPSDTYEWSETSCNTYGFQPLTGSSGPSGLGAILGPTPPIPYYLEIAPPSNPIVNIADYFKCFTQGSSPDHTYTVQLCVDQPTPGTRVPWTLTPGGPAGSIVAQNLVDVGHTFLVLTENDQGNIITRNVGFYPSGFVMPANHISSSQGVLNNDDVHAYNISISIGVSSSQFFGILSDVALGNNQGYYYDINSNNCTTFAINALTNNGIQLPVTKGVWTGGGGDDPGDLGEDIRQMQLGSNMARNTTSSPHPNVGNCQ